jgi:proteasome lid subunit RPN8/RPN11
MLTLTKAGLKNIREHALIEAPKEACGILAGPRNQKITEVFRCTNTDENPLTAYTIDPKELLETINEIERSPKNLKPLGFYHSHPFSSSSPSAIDVGRATWDGFFYLIYSIPKDEIKVWKWMEDQERFVAEELKIL